MYIPTGGWPVAPTEDEILESPWKYVGYKDFASFTASNSDFIALRRFGRLHTRILLTLQAQLSDMEQRLDNLDKHYAAKTTKLGKAGLVDTRDFAKEELPPDLEDVNNGSVLDDIPERAELVNQIQKKLSLYDKALVEYYSVREMPSAPARNIKNIRSWFGNNVGAIDSDEAKFIEHTSDLLSFSQPKPRLRQLFDDHVVYHARHSFRLFKQLAPQSQLSERDQEATYMVSEDILATAGSIAMLLGATTMLIVPLWVLQIVGNLKVKLAVITICMLLCLLFLTFAVMGRPLERLAVTAGYAAVLVVFLQRDG